MGKLADDVLSKVPEKPEKKKGPKRDIPEQTPNYVARRGADCDDFSDLEQQSRDAPKENFYRSHWR